MIRLLYFSQAVPTMKHGDLEAILVAARRSNREKGITGVLVTGGRVFLQILEGPQESVLSLYLNILRDKRHTDVEIMRVTPTVDRLFDDWAMEVFEATPLQFMQVMQFKTEHFALGETREFVGAVRGLMNVLRKQN